ncbi:hypothetical protein GOODEAATRI_033310, partial [Goodea atripinnis]
GSYREAGNSPPEAGPVEPQPAGPGEDGEGGGQRQAQVGQSPVHPVLHGLLHWNWQRLV